MAAAPVPDPRWLKRRLARRAKQLRLPRLPQAALARHLGVAPSAIPKIWLDGRQPSAREIAGIAEFLNVPPADVLAWLGAPVAHALLKVAIAGFVGAGQEIIGFDDYAKGGGHGEVDCPLDLDPEEVVAVEVRGDSMRPMKDGWRLFVRRDWYGVLDEHIGRLCVVETEDGHRYVKEVRRAAAGRFNLYAWSADPIENVRLKWAARVLAIIPA